MLIKNRIFAAERKAILLCLQACDARMGVGAYPRLIQLLSCIERSAASTTRSAS